jgi:hypothetical protein
MTVMIIFAMLGGIIGSGLGSRQLSNTMLYSLLAVMPVNTGKNS